MSRPPDPGAAGAPAAAPVAAPALAPARTPSSSPAASRLQAPRAFAPGSASAGGSPAGSPTTSSFALSGAGAGAGAGLSAETGTPPATREPKEPASSPAARIKRALSAAAAAAAARAGAVSPVRSRIAVHAAPASAAPTSEEKNAVPPPATPAAAAARTPVRAPATPRAAAAHAAAGAGAGTGAPAAGSPRAPAGKAAVSAAAAAPARAGAAKVGAGAGARPSTSTSAPKAGAAPAKAPAPAAEAGGAARRVRTSTAGSTGSASAAGSTSKAGAARPAVAGGSRIAASSTPAAIATAPPRTSSAILARRAAGASSSSSSSAAAPAAAAARARASTTSTSTNTRASAPAQASTPATPRSSVGRASGAAAAASAAAGGLRPRASNASVRSAAAAQGRTGTASPARAASRATPAGSSTASAAGSSASSSLRGPRASAVGAQASARKAAPPPLKLATASTTRSSGAAAGAARRPSAASVSSSSGAGGAAGKSSGTAAARPTGAAGAARPVAAARHPNPAADVQSLSAPARRWSAWTGETAGASGPASASASASGRAAVDEHGALGGASADKDAVSEQGGEDAPQYAPRPRADDEDDSSHTTGECDGEGRSASASGFSFFPSAGAPGRLSRQAPASSRPTTPEGTRSAADTSEELHTQRRRGAKQLAGSVGAAPAGKDDGSDEEDGDGAGADDPALDALLLASLHALEVSNALLVSTLSSRHELARLRAYERALDASMTQREAELHLRIQGNRSASAFVQKASDDMQGLLDACKQLGIGRDSALGARSNSGAGAGAASGSRTLYSGAAWRAPGLTRALSDMPTASASMVSPQFSFAAQPPASITVGSAPASFDERTTDGAAATAPAAAASAPPMAPAHSRSSSSSSSSAWRLPSFSNPLLSPTLGGGGNAGGGGLLGIVETREDAPTIGKTAARRLEKVLKRAAMPASPVKEGAEGQAEGEEPSKQAAPTVEADASKKAPGSAPSSAPPSALSSPARPTVALAPPVIREGGKLQHRRMLSQQLGIPDRPPHKASVPALLSGVTSRSASAASASSAVETFSSSGSGGALHEQQQSSPALPQEVQWNTRSPALASAASGRITAVDASQGFATIRHMPRASSSIAPSDAGSGSIRSASAIHEQDGDEHEDDEHGRGDAASIAESADSGAQSITSAGRRSSKRMSGVMIRSPSLAKRADGRRSIASATLSMSMEGGDLLDAGLAAMLDGPEGESRQSKSGGGSRAGALAALQKLSGVVTGGTPSTAASSTASGSGWATFVPSWLSPSASQQPLFHAEPGSADSSANPSPRRSLKADQQASSARKEIEGVLGNGEVTIGARHARKLSHASSLLSNRLSTARSEMSQ